MEQIKRIGFAEADRQQVENEVIKAVENDPEKFILRYINDQRSFGGRYVNADLFKEQFEQYRKSKETRNRYNNVIHNAAAVLASELYRRVVADRSNSGRDKAIFITGIPGAGKSSSILEQGTIFPKNAKVIYEGQLANPSPGIIKIEQALNAGLKPYIIAVHTLPENALANTLKRFNEFGRGSSIHTMASIQGFLPNGLEEIYRHFGNNVILEIHDRRDRNQPKEFSGWQHLEILKSEGDYERIRERLAKELERQRPNISDEAYLQARGNAPSERKSYCGRVAETDGKGLHTNVSGRELSQRSSKTAVLDAHYLCHFLTESALKIKSGDFSHLMIASDLIDKMIALKKESIETQNIIEKTIENYAKDIKLTKLIIPQDKTEITLEINRQLTMIDKHFDVGMGR